MNAPQQDGKVCFSCGSKFENEYEIAGSHEYMLSGELCWAAYGAVLAREYQDQSLFAAAHRLSVDAFALQHPGDLSDPRAAQSVWVHAISLHSIFVHGLSHSSATKKIGAATQLEFPRLSPVDVKFEVTHENVLAGELSHHTDRVREWAQSAYQSWSHIHPDLDRLFKSLD